MALQACIKILMKRNWCISNIPEKKAKCFCLMIERFLLKAEHPSWIIPRLSQTVPTTKHALGSTGMPLRLQRTLHVFWKPYPIDYLLSNFMNDYLSTSWYWYTSDVGVNLNFLSDSWDGTIGGWAQITIPTGDPELVPWDPRGISGLGHPASIGTLWEDSERSWDT